jgi:hypothetical protein
MKSFSFVKQGSRSRKLPTRCASVLEPWFESYRRARTQQRLLERVDRADVRLGRSRAHSHAQRRLGQLNVGLRG